MKFSDFGFKKFINDGLEKKEFYFPTPIQEEVIPLMKKHQNVVAKAHTGTGKTYAFLLPILNNLNYDNPEIQALIIAPSRELAQQIFEDVRFFKQFNDKINVGLFIGGDDTEKTREKISQKQPMIAIGTPSKLKELYEENLLRVTTAKWIVVDEFDMIFDLGFFEDLDFMMEKARKDAVKALFSATFNEVLRPFLKKYIPNGIFVDKVLKEQTSKNIKHVIVDTKNKDNKVVLEALIKFINPYISLIFVNSKEEVPKVVGWLKEFGLKNIGEIHGGLQPRTRNAMLKKIKNNEFNYIVATDVAARGIDIEGLSDVISIDLPKDLSYYVHRSGRTGRQNFSGTSYVLYNIKNKDKISVLEKNGINFEIVKLINNELVPVQKPKAKKATVMGTEEKKVLNRYKNQKVKPGYKKKRKQELDQIKKKRRRKHIKENIERIKKEKYKKRQKEVFGK